MAFPAELGAMLGLSCGSRVRLSFGFHNPNHAAVASGAWCAMWGEDDTRRVAPRERIDPEFLNPLYSGRIAALWRKDAP